MTLPLSGANVGHVAVAAGLTYALGFERNLRGAAAGDRVFALIGIGSAVLGTIAAHRAPKVLAGAITGIGFIGPQHRRRPLCRRGHWGRRARAACSSRWRPLRWRSLC